METEINMTDSKKPTFLVVDVNYLTTDLKDLSYQSIKDHFKEQYNIEAVLIDGSRQNLQGTPQTNYQPIYLI